MFLTGVIGRGDPPVALARCTVPCGKTGFWAMTLAAKCSSVLESFTNKAFKFS